MSNPHLQLARGFRRGLQVNPGIDGPWQWATIQATHTGPNRVDVYLDNNLGTITPGVPYLDSYSPTIGDVVLVARLLGKSRNTRVVLGKCA